MPRRLPGVIPFVTVLPAAAVSGQVVDFDTGTVGVVWRLRYNAASASAYKWEFVGGSPLIDEVVTSETTTSTSYIDLTTVGPDVTIPLAGDYMIGFGSEQNNNTASRFANMAIKLGAAAAVNADAVISGGAANADASCWRTMRRDGLAASDLLIAKYAVGTSGTAQFQKRMLIVTPVRVG